MLISLIDSGVIMPKILEELYSDKKILSISRGVFEKDRYKANTEAGNWYYYNPKERLIYNTSGAFVKMDMWFGGFLGE